MSTSKEKFAEAKALAQQAQDVFATDKDEGQRLLDEAKQVVTVAEGLQDTETTLKSLSEPQYLDIDSTVEDTVPNTKDVIYELKYGTMSTAVKQVTDELYGGKYQQHRMKQNEVFNRYLRDVRSTHLDLDDERLLKINILPPADIELALKSGVSVAELKATGVEGIDDLGGYTVPVDFRNEMIRRIASLSVVRPRAKVTRTTRDRIQIPKKGGGNDQYTSTVRVYPVDETPASLPSTNLTFEMVNIPVHTIMASAPLSRNLIEDAAFDIVGELITTFAEANATQEDNWFMTGDGTGKPRGILPNNVPDTITQVVDSGSSGAFTWNKILEMVTTLPQQYRNNCVWIMPRTAMADIMQLQTGSGLDYVWKPFQYSGGEGGISTMPLLGYPVLEQDILPDPAANSYSLILANLQGYRIVDHVGGMTVERFLDSTSASSNTVNYIMRRRFGGQVVEPYRFVVQKLA